MGVVRRLSFRHASDFVALRNVRLLIHLDAVPLLPLRSDVEGLRNVRLIRDEIRGRDEDEEPEPVGHDYDLTRQEGAVRRRGDKERGERGDDGFVASLGVRVVGAVAWGSLFVVDPHHADVRDGEDDGVDIGAPGDSRADRAALALDVGQQESDPRGDDEEEEGDRVPGPGPLPEGWQGYTSYQCKGKLAGYRFARAWEQHTS